MTLRHMKIYVDVFHHSNITKAAEELHLAQPSVSLAIKELEEYYGIPSSLSATLHSFWLAIFSPHPLQNRKRHDITWPEEPKWSFGWWTSLAFTDYETEQLHKALLWLPRRCGDWSSQFPIRSRWGSCIRRCWKHWCTALAGSYLNTQKGRRNAAFPRHAG